MQRIGLAGAAEEGHVDAAHVMLVDQHARRGRRASSARSELERRIETGRNQRAHAACADLDDGVGDGADIRPAVTARCVSSRRLRADQRRQLPVGEMRGEDQRRLAVVAQVLEALVDRLRRRRMSPWSGRLGFEDLQAVEMGEFGGDAAEIVPDRRAGCPRSRCGLFRKGGREIGAADAVLRAASGPSRAHEARRRSSAMRGAVDQRGSPAACRRRGDRASRRQRP